jgi:hypothetical protein
VGARRLFGTAITAAPISELSGGTGKVGIPEVDILLDPLDCRMLSC